MDKLLQAVDARALGLVPKAASQQRFLVGAVFLPCMPLPQSTMSACLYWYIGGESSTGSLASSFFLIAPWRSSMPSMPGASSQPQVAAKQLLKHISRFCLPVENVLIFTGCTLMDQGIAASSGSLGPGSTRLFVCANATGASRV